jgi:1-deoxy-D-xylulose-5-phosphate synthase
MTIEEGSVGGFASHVLELLAGEGVLDRGLKFRPLVLPDVFIEQDSPAKMYAAAALDARGIAAAALAALKKEHIPVTGEIGPGKRLA